MLQYEHWIGEDTVFALYDDGRVIYAPRKKQDGASGTLVSGYYSVVLTTDEAREQREWLDRSGFFDLRDSYKLSDWTCEPAVTMYAWQDGKPKRCYVYGDLRREQETRHKAPKGLLNLFDRLADYRHDRAKPWMPVNVEVLLSELPKSPVTLLPDGAKGPFSETTWFLRQPVEWPKHWPDLDNAHKENWGTDYNIYLPSKRFKRFAELRNKQRAVKVNGRRFTVSYRFPLPREDLWFDSPDESPTQDGGERGQE
jgi:hypothetical protein